MSKNYYVVKSNEDFLGMCKHVQDHDIIAYDTETTGLNVRKERVIGFSVSAIEGWGYYFPIWKWEDAELKPAYTGMEGHLGGARLLLDLLIGKKLLMFNASFDVRITKNALDVDLLPSLYCDVMLLKHTCDEDFPFGLKPIAKKIQEHIGLDMDKVANQEQLDMLASIKENGGQTTKDCYELYKADYEKIGIYACADTDLTLRVFNYYSKVLKEEGLERFFYEDEVMPLYKEVTIPMEQGGIPINVSMIENARKEITQDIVDLEHEIQKQIKPYLGTFYDWYLNREFPASNRGAFAQAVCSFANLDLPKTATGKFSIKKENLLALKPCSYSKFLLGDGYLDNNTIREIQLSVVEDDGYVFNISSKHHLAKLFFDELGEKSITKTDKGRPQMNDLFLDSVSDKYDFVNLIRTFNKLNKLRSAYMDRFLEREEDGMFYPSFMQHRTVSGRYGSDMQQLPRPIDEQDKDKVDYRVYKYTNMIRAFFESGENYVFIDADYESLEPHVFAHVSGDEGLKNIFRTGNDFYSTIAIDTEQLEEVSANKKAENYLGAVDKAKRQSAKAYALGIPYGMEAFKLSKTLEISQSQAEKLIEAYLNAYPKLKEWMIKSNEQCKKYGRVKSQAGRIRHMKLAAGIYHQERSVLFDRHGELIDALELWKKFHEIPNKYSNYKWKRKTMKNFLNNAKNWQIQSLAASITNRACIGIARELKRQNADGYICAQVHDQIVVRVRKSEAEKWRKNVQYIMENAYKISLKLKAPAEIGTNLKEAH